MSDLIRVADAWEKQCRGNDAGTYIIAVAGDMVRDALVWSGAEDPVSSMGTHPRR